MVIRADQERIAESVYAHQRREIEGLIQQALGKYGRPRMSLQDLRAELAKQLKGRSLSELLIAERLHDDAALR